MHSCFPPGAGPVMTDVDTQMVEVEKPHDGWKSRRLTNAEAPWTGDGPQYVWIDLETSEPATAHGIGLSAISLGGDRWDKVSPEMDKFWKSLCKYVGKNAAVIPGDGIRTAKDIDYLCWPSALEQIRAAQ